MKKPWRNRRKEPDKRLDWRDPDMPVLRMWEGPLGDVGLRELSPESETEYAQDIMRRSISPNYQNDPSYNWAKRKRKTSDKVKEAMIMNEAKVDPLMLARSHQASIKTLIERELADASCIRRLLVGKTVTTGADQRTYVVTESRLGLGGNVMLYGKKVGANRNSRRIAVIGTVHQIKIVESKP